MLTNNLVTALDYALTPRIITCVAGIWATNNQYCLPAQTAAKVIQNSGCRVIVIHIPNPKNTNMNLENVLEVDHLLRELNIPISNFVLFFNTSLCSTLEEVRSAINRIRFIFSLPPYKKAISAFIKLEMLDANLQPNDSRTLEILNELPPDICNICIPFLSGEINSLQHAISLGCPAIRIWCSNIGQGQGIIDEKRLNNVLNSIDIPLILEGGLRTPKDVQKALTMGFKAVLMNSAFRHSKTPINLAKEIRITIKQINTN